MGIIYMSPFAHFDASFAARRLRRRAGFDLGLGRYRKTRSAMVSRALGTAIFNLPSIFQIADKPFSANEDRPVFLRSLS